MFIIRTHQKQGILKSTHLPYCSGRLLHHYKGIEPQNSLIAVEQQLDDWLMNE